MYLGDYIVIDEEKGPYNFLCSCVSTGTIFTAVVDNDKRTLFDNSEFLKDKPHACSFLRAAEDGRILCTIHETSPAQCKAYRCILMEIFTNNIRIGYITGTWALHSDNKKLREIYETGLTLLPTEFEDKERWMAEFLVEKGYMVK
jgi:hypothetical protein